MKVFLDDIRTAPYGWVKTTSAEGTIELLKTGKVIELSLDYDLSATSLDNGYDVLIWLEEEIKTNNNFVLPLRITIHSSHSKLKPRMEAAVINLYKLKNQN